MACNTLTKEEEVSQLRNLRSHSTRLLDYLNAVENNTPLLSLDKTEQRILRKLGVLETTQNITEEAEASDFRLYENRPLTEALLIDIGLAGHAAAEPNVIGCMCSAFAQGLSLSTAKDSRRITELCEEGAQWSLRLWQQSWKEAEQTRNDARLKKSIEAYRHAYAFHRYLTLSIPVAGQQTEHEANIHHMDMSLDHLFLDIQRGLSDERFNARLGRDVVMGLSKYAMPTEILKAML